MTTVSDGAWNRTAGAAKAGACTVSASGVGCSLGCEFKTSTKYSWPKWSHDASTPKRIEAAHLQALQAAGS